jgi:hypothetical protein
VANAREAQLRLLYSLLKPAMRTAARFHIPLRTLIELVRLAYFEHLQREGLSHGDIARRFGQTDRNMRSLAKKLKSNFFVAEQEVGLVREVENAIAIHAPTSREDLFARLPHVAPSELDGALASLGSEGRIEPDEAGRWQVPARYHVLSSELFHHRIDALNHFLDGMYRAVLQRLIFDDRERAMVKAITFSAKPSALHAYMTRFEGALRRDIAELEEEAAFEGHQDDRFTLGIVLADAGDSV